jgi:ABC-type sugar transport system ATPase subunit
MVWSDLLIDGRRIVKMSGDVRALRGPDFAISAGGVVRLAGGNGAGNNTLTSVRAAVMLLDPKPLVMREEAPFQRGLS